MTEATLATGPVAGDLLQESAESLRQAAVEATPAAAVRVIERLLGLVDLFGPALPHRRTEHLQKAARDALDRLTPALRWERDVAALLELRGTLDNDHERAAVEHVLDFAQRRARRAAPRSMARQVNDLASLGEDLAKKAREREDGRAPAPDGNGLQAVAEGFFADAGHARQALAVVREHWLAWSTSPDGASSPFRASLEAARAGLEHVVEQQALARLLARRADRLRGRGMDALLTGLERAAAAQAARMDAAVEHARAALRSTLPPAPAVEEASVVSEAPPTEAPAAEPPAEEPAPRARRRRAAEPTE